MFSAKSCSSQPAWLWRGSAYLMAVLGLSCAAPAALAATKPNIVVIVNDDLGWGDVGYHGAEIRTPNLNALAKRGVELNRYYTYAVCSPMRAALMSGRSSLETGVDAPIALDKVLPLDATLLPEHLKRVGYQTVMVGKWHLGQAKTEYLPFKRGFDYYYGFLGGFIDHYTHLTPDGNLDWQRNGVSVREEGYTTDLFTADAISQIKSRDKKKPLFLYLAYDAPHTPLQAPAEVVAKYADIADPIRRTYAAMVDHADAQIARVLATIESEGMAKDTIIIWVSDNGPETRGGGTSGGLRMGKGTSFEGGQRVPAIAYWPGHLEGGKKLDSVVTVLDWFPTLIAAAGGKVPQDKRIVGHDVMKSLRSGKVAQPTQMVMGNHAQRAGAYYESAYQWPWKIVRAPAALLNAAQGPRPGGPGSGAAPPASGAAGPDDKVTMLFDVVSDPNESNDVAAANPQIVARLLADLEAAPRAPASLSEWGGNGRAGAAGGPPGGGPPGGGPPGGGPPRGGPAAGGGGDRLPGGGNALQGYTVEKGEPVAEAAARGAVLSRGQQ
jgi:arylsulfatase A-like enzyme